MSPTDSSTEGHAVLLMLCLAKCSSSQSFLMCLLAPGQAALQHKGTQLSNADVSICFGAAFI